MNEWLNHHLGPLLLLCAALLFLCLYALGAIDKTLTAWHDDFKRAHHLDEDDPE